MNYHLAHLPAVQQAIAAAAACNSATELQDAIRTFDAHELCAQPAMPGRAGDRCMRNRPVMILGKAPAGTEAETRVPFSGPAGQVLRREMQAIGRDVEQCWISCASPWKARKNNPNATLLSIARPFVMREIEVVDPAVVICLGQKALELLTQDAGPFADRPGQVLDYRTLDGSTRPVVVTHCHAAVMYDPTKSDAFRAHLSMAFEIADAP